MTAPADGYEFTADDLGDDAEVALAVAAESDGDADRPSRLRRLVAHDTRFLQRVESWRREWLTPLMKGFTLLGNTEAWGLHAILLLVVFERNVGTRWALLLLTAALLASVVGQLLKRTCRRRRPSVALGDTDFVALRDDPDAFSFPSGHTCAAFAVAAALADEGFAIGATEYALATGIGFSRLYLGAHYPLDVIVGALIGTACGLAVRTGLLPLLVANGLTVLG